MKPTMEQAKKRYKSYTRGVMTKEFKKVCDAAQWGMEDGYPGPPDGRYDPSALPDG
jgi:hypothetical protein